MKIIFPILLLSQVVLAQEISINRHPDKFREAGVIVVVDSDKPKEINDVRIKKTRTLIIQDADNNEPLSNASIKVSRSDGPADSLIIIADQKAEIDLKPISSWKEYEMEISCVGYKSKTIKVTKGELTNVARLEKDYKKMEEIIIVSYGTIYCRSLCCCPSIIVTKTTFEQKQPSMPTHFQFVIYPNPVGRSEKLTVKLNQGMNGKIEIISAEGQIVQSLEVDQNKNFYPSFQLSNLSAGVYFVRLTDSKTKKSMTEKLIVQ